MLYHLPYIRMDKERHLTRMMFSLSAPCARVETDDGKRRRAAARGF